MLTRLFLLSLFCLTALPAMAESTLVCSKTHSITSQFYPGPEKIAHDNNLRRKPGSAVFADGRPMLIIGRVVDEDCVPVMDAVIELWQANNSGRYDHPHGRPKGARPDFNFSGSGRASSDNMGFFQFTTIYPGLYGKQAPRLYFRIRKKDMPTLSTAVFLADSPAAQTDGTVKKLSEAARRQLLLTPALYNPVNPEQGYYLEVTFTLAKEQKYRNF